MADWDMTNSITHALQRLQRLRIVIGSKYARALRKHGRICLRAVVQLASRDSHLTARLSRASASRCCPTCANSYDPTASGNPSQMPLPEYRGSLRIQCDLFATQARRAVTRLLLHHTLPHVSRGPRPDLLVKQLRAASESFACERRNERSCPGNQRKGAPARAAGYSAPPSYIAASVSGRHPSG